MRCEPHPLILFLVYFQHHLSPLSFGEPNDVGLAGRAQPSETFSESIALLAVVVGPRFERGGGITLVIFGDVSV